MALGVFGGVLRSVVDGVESSEDVLEGVNGRNVLVRDLMACLHCDRLHHLFLGGYRVVGT